MYSQSLRDSVSMRFLDEVILTDTKVASKRSESGKTVIRIGPEELARFEGKSALELINLKSGIEISGSRGRAGEVPGVFIRGGRGRQTIVYIDGARVNDPSTFSNTFDLRLLDTSIIESIEIVKGASSTLYGSNAATGVIFIQTKRESREAIEAAVSSSVGTNQTSDDQSYNANRFNNSIQLRGKTGNLRYGAHVSHGYSDGVSSINTASNEEDKNTLLSSGAYFGIDPTERWSLDLKLLYAKLDTEYDESFGLEDADYSFMSEQRGIFLNSRYALKKGEIRFNAGYNDFQSENISAFPGTFEGQNLTFDLYAKNQISSKVTAIYGLNLNREKALLANEESFTVFDPYATFQAEVTEKMRLNAGIRLNTHSEYGAHWVYSINPVYHILKGTVPLKVFGSYSSSYITPTLNQLYGDFGANPNLEPESNTTLELGMETAVNGEFRTSLLYFEREEENFVFFNNDLFLFQNAEEVVRVQGLEFEGYWYPTSRMDIIANYTFTQRKGDTAIRLPRHKGMMQWGYRFGKTSRFTFQYVYTGKRSDTDFNTFSDVELDPFSIVNMSFSHALKPGKLRVFAHLDNIFNTQFEEVVGFNTLGRNIRLGFHLDIQ